MTIDEIKELIRVVHETGIAELEVQRGENRVWIRGAVPAAAETVASFSTPVPAAGAPAIPAHPSMIAAATNSPAAPPEGAGHELVKSPIVGTYYDSPAPGEPPFVKVGDKVKAKQVLCIIESMKLMNEIEAEQAGVIVEKHVETGRPVEYGELLFTIRAV